MRVEELPEGDVRLQNLGSPITLPDGTQRELDTYMRLREARRQVSAFDKWLKWVDDEDNANAPPADEVPLEEVLGH